MPDKHIVVRPNYVVFQLRSGKPAVFAKLAAVVVVGGRAFEGNGYVDGEPLAGKFSHGYDAPDSVGVIRADDKKFLRSDVERVMICGGTEVKPGARVVPAGTGADALIARLVASLEPAVEDVIGGHSGGGAGGEEQDEPVHIITNNATTEIADHELQDGRTSSGVYKDDFLDLLHQRTKAAIGPNGEILHDDFDILWNLQKNHHEDLQAQAPFTRSNPVSVTNALLGSLITVSPGQPVMAARFDGDDAETGPVTVTLGPINAQPVQVAGNKFTGGTVAYRPFARVQWGTRDYQFSVDIDVGQGSQFTVNASSVVVYLGLDANIPANSPPLKMAGMISFKPCVRTTSLTRTLYADALAAQTAVFFNVPAYAKKCVMQRPAIGGLSEIEVSFVPYNVLGALVTFDFPAVGTGFEVLPENSMIIPGDAAYIEVFNNDLASAQSVKIICELAI